MPTTGLDQHPRRRRSVQDPGKGKLRTRGFGDFERSDSIISHFTLVGGPEVFEILYSSAGKTAHRFFRRMEAVRANPTCSRRGGGVGNRTQIRLSGVRNIFKFETQWRAKVLEHFHIIRIKLAQL